MLVIFSIHFYGWRTRKANTGEVLKIADGFKTNWTGTSPSIYCYYCRWSSLASTRSVFLHVTYWRFHVNLTTPTDWRGSTLRNPTSTPQLMYLLFKRIRWKMQFFNNYNREVISSKDIIFNSKFKRSSNLKLVSDYNWFICSLISDVLPSSSTSARYIFLSSLPAPFFLVLYLSPQKASSAPRLCEHCRLFLVGG